jgi:hypothetical protein
MAKTPNSSTPTAFSDITDLFSEATILSDAPDGLLSNKTSFRKTIMRGNGRILLYEPVFISGEDYIRKIFQISPMDTSNAIFERHLSTPLSTPRRAHLLVDMVADIQK